MNIRQEGLKKLIERCFQDKQIEERLIRSKQVMKNLNGLKVELVALIKDTEAFKTVMENSEVSDYSSENLEHCETEKVGKSNAKEREKVNRPRTPDINSMKQGQKDTGLNRMNNRKEGNGISTFNQSNASKFALSKKGSIQQESLTQRDNTPIRNAKKTTTMPQSDSPEPSNTTSNTTKKGRSFDLNGSHPKLQTKTNSKGNITTSNQRKPTGKIINKSRSPTPDNHNRTPTKKEKPTEPKIQQPSIREYIQSRTNNIIKCSSNQIEALNICLKSNYLTSKESMSILMNSPELHRLNTALIKAHLNALIALRESKLNELNATLSHYDSAIVFKNFTPSKTATNGLNFITKEEESNLRQRQQQVQVINIFKAILIMANEPFDNIKNNDIIQHIFTFLLPKHSCETLKTFLITKLGKTIACTNESIAKLIAFSDENPNLFSVIELIKINRSVSYMNFILKEYFDYLTYKFQDGAYLYHVKLFTSERDKLQSAIRRLKSFIQPADTSNTP